MKLPQYCTKIGKSLYFQRRFPTSIQNHPSISDKANFKVRLLSPPDDIVAITSEIQKINNDFEAYVRTLSDANSEIIEKLELTKRAKAYLRLNGLEPAQAAAYNDYERPHFLDFALEKADFDAANQYSWLMQNSKDPMLPPPSKLVQVQEEAWKLLNLPIHKQPKTHTLNDCWSLYTREKDIEARNRANNRSHTSWELFLNAGGGDTLLNQSVVDDYIDAFVEIRLKEVKPQSIQRQLTTIIAALNMANDKFRLRLNIKKPRINTKQLAAESKPPLTHTQQRELLTLATDSSQRQYKPWKELFVLLALQSGAHASELIKLRREDMHLDSDVPYITLNYQDGAGKTLDRVRYVPLVLHLKRIKELLLAGALEDLTSKTTDNISNQIKRLMAQVDEKATAYSLRHTLKHNADIAGIDSAIIASLGGWSGKSENLSKHMMGYGRESKETTERLRALQKHQLKIHNHLLIENVDNIVDMKKEASESGYRY